MQTDILSIQEAMIDIILHTEQVNIAETISDLRSEHARA
jgi:hypothetical protein